MSTTQSTINVKGMMCDACVGHVTRALQAIDGVQSVSVSLAENSADVSYNASIVTPAVFIAAIQEEGYEASV